MIDTIGHALINGCGYEFYCAVGDISPEDENSFERLYNKTFDRLGWVNGQVPINEYNPKNDFHIAALLFSAFKPRRIVQESFIPTDQNETEFLAHEALTRTMSYHYAFRDLPFPIEDIAKKFYNIGLHVEFDELLCRNALKAAVKFPVTLNVHPKSLLDNRFLDSIIEILRDYSADDIIFEILEYDFPDNPDISRLEYMKDMGYRFLLDDHTVLPSSDGKLVHDPLHQKLLETFDPIIFGIKIDGLLIRAGLEDNSNNVIHHADNCYRLIDYIKTQRPDDIIIAERVYNKEEIATLQKHYVDYVQGRSLELDHYRHLNRPWEKSEFDATTSKKPEIILA